MSSSSIDVSLKSRGETFCLIHQEMNANRERNIDLTNIYAEKQMNKVVIATLINTHTFFLYKKGQI